MPDERASGRIAAMSASVRATAFHEAAHAVTAYALGHVVKCVMIDPRPNVPCHGKTCRMVAGPGDPALLNEECAIVEVIGGLAEIKHDPKWRTDRWHREDDLRDVRERLANTGSGAPQIAAFMGRCDVIAGELLRRECLWRGIEAVAARMEEAALKTPDEPTWLTDVSATIAEAFDPKCLEEVARSIRSHAPGLNALRR